MSIIKIAIEVLDYNSIVDFFLSTIQDFPDLKKRCYLEERAMKLSKYAEFVTCRTHLGKMVGMIAFYRNRPPLCYITHVSVLVGYRGNGLFERMCTYLVDTIDINQYQLMELEVKKNNVSAIGCYRKCGFEFLDKERGESLYMVKWLKK